MINILNLEIDFSILTNLNFNSFWEILYFVLSHGGWILFAWLFLQGAWIMWVSYRQTLYDQNREFVVLAIDVPQDNFQTPKAVENFFAQLHTIYSGGNLIDKYWYGKIPETVSLELISIDGYTQFIIRANKFLRDLIEAALYAQYPDAEITEVADYVKEVPNEFPDEEYDMFGTELVLAKDNAYPIKTYIEFEDRISGEIKDPISATLESLSKLQKGEQLWLQFVIYPALDKEWKPQGEILVKKLSGISIPESPKSTFIKILEFPINIVINVFDLLFGIESSPQKEEIGEPSMLMHLPPGQKRIIEQVERKISKLGFWVSFKLIYIAKKSVFNKARGLMPIFGALRQYNTQNMNFLIPAADTATNADYFFVNYRIQKKQNKIMSNYRSRSLSAGANPFILNTEELATLYHFPSINVKTPLLKKTSGRKAEAPSNIPRLR